MSGPLVVFGAGGHGKVVCDILLECGETVAGFLDDGKKPGDRILLDYAVLGGMDWLRKNPTASVALGIGANRAREKIADACRELGVALKTAIHPRAIVSRTALVEEGVVVMALAVINADARIERGTIINTAAVIEHDCAVGPFAHISPNAALAGNCTVHARAHLGIGAAMLPGTSIGEDATVGGGALVARDIEARRVATGVPARIRPD